MKISFIIPCYNEEKNIGHVLNSIKPMERLFGSQFEVIVIDNGSSDNGPTIAQHLGAKVYRSHAQTVAGVRNDGVHKSSGELLIFIDADVLLTSNWFNNIERVVDYIFTNTLTITGSHCEVPDSLGGTLKPWYELVGKDTRNTHLGSGHMLMHKSLFTKIGGFDKSLKSGEDFDLCERAKKIGAEIKINPALKVYHLGYPSNLSQFFKRELWHGMGDGLTLKRTIESKVALSSIVFFLLHALMITSLAQGNTIIALIILTTIALSTGSLIFYKFGAQHPSTYLKALFPAYLYLIARFLSLFAVRFRRW